MITEEQRQKVLKALRDSYANLTAEHTTEKEFENIIEAMEIVKNLIIPIVSQQSELLKALIGKEENATLLNGKKCRVLKSVEESFLIQENHNDKIRWVGISDIDTKSL